MYIFVANYAYSSSGDAYTYMGLVQIPPPAKTPLWLKPFSKNPLPAKKKTSNKNPPPAKNHRRQKLPSR